MSDATEANRLLEFYRQYIGDPDRAVDVYAGFGLFFAGLALGAAGVVTFLYSATLPPNTLSTYAVREVAAVAGSVGLPALLVGVVVLLPVDRRMLFVAAAGSVVCLGATALFVWAYPQDWNVVTPPDYSARGVAVYSVGLVAVIAATGAALVAHRVERATVGAGGGAAGAAAGGAAAEDDAAEPTEAEVRADIERELSDAELTWGGVERSQTRRLELDTSAVDDVDREQLAGSATETRTSDDGVSDAVAQLKGLQGGEAETASGESTDDQAAALRELREQQRESESEDRSLLDRLRDRL